MPRGSITSPFGKFVAARGLTLKDIPFANARKLSQRPESVAPNSPILPLIAAHLKVPPETIIAFAKGKPLAARWVNKIQHQLADNTLPRGTKTRNSRHLGHRQRPDRQRRLPNPATSSNVKHSFTKFALERGLSLIALSEQTGIQQPALWRLAGGHIAPNHPMITIVADALKVPEADIAQFAQSQPLTGGYLDRARQQLEESGVRLKPGTAVVLSSTVVPNGKSNGNGVGEHKPGKYNRLKRGDLQLRQSARAMVATLNVSIMRGDTHMPPLPVSDLYLVLQDYLIEKGVKENVLVSPAFAELFDRK